MRAERELTGFSYPLPSMSPSDGGVVGSRTFEGVVPALHEWSASSKHGEKVGRVVKSPGEFVLWVATPGGLDVVGTGGVLASMGDEFKGSSSLLSIPSTRLVTRFNESKILMIDND